MDAYVNLCRMPRLLVFSRTPDPSSVAAPSSYMPVRCWLHASLRVSRCHVRWQGMLASRIRTAPTRCRLPHVGDVQKQHARGRGNLQEDSRAAT